MKKISCIFLCFFFLSFLFAQKAGAAEDYALTFFKKFNATQKKLTYMNKKGALAKVGTETVQGELSGTIFYHVKIKGAGAEVILRYTDYSDEEGWVFDGEIITHSNMAQNGSFEGTIKVSGIIPGEINYDKVRLVKGNPGDGFYSVTLQGKKPEEVSYKVYLNSKE